MKKAGMFLAIGLVLVVLLATGKAQVQTGGEISFAGGPFRLLIVDETKGFEPTVRVGILAKVLKDSGMVDVSVMLADVDSAYDDPLHGRTPGEDEEPYDIILIVSKGIDDGSAPFVWIVFGSFDGGEGAVDLEAAMEMLGLFRGVIDTVFQGIAEAVDITKDFYPMLLGAFHQASGWLR